MALFQGEETVDVTTPDGRTLTLPRSIVPASLLPQIAPTGAPAGALPMNVPAQQPAQEAPAPSLPAPTEEPGTPPNVVESPASVVEMGEPETRRVTQQQLAKEQMAQKAAQVKAAKARTAYNASPGGQRANAQAKQDEAVKNEEQAIYGVADVEAAEQATVADALQKRNEQLDTLFIKRNQEAQANLEAENAKMDEITGLRKKISGTKIDRTADHPVLLAISAALAGIGSAMNGEKVDTYSIITNVIDRKVAAQEADLDRMGEVYGMTKEELDMLKDKSKSRLEFHNAMIAAETDKAVRHIEELTARSASEKTKANAKVLISQLQARAADKSAEAMRWGLEFDQRDKHQRAQIGLGYANLRQADKHHKDDMQLKREGMYLDYQRALAADKARGDEAMFKARMDAQGEVEKRGLKGRDNDYLLTPQGRAKMEEAARLEQEAKTLESNPDPMARSVASNKIELLKQKASVLRGDARTFDVVRARSDTQAGDMSKKYAAAQTMMDTVDEINMLYDEAGRGVITKDKLQEELQAKYGLLAVAAKDAWQLGAWDKGSAKLVSDIIGQDPSTEWNVGLLGAAWNQQAIKDPNGFKNRLKAVTTKLEQDVREQFTKNSSWDGQGELFTRKQAKEISGSARDLSKAPSGIEIEKSADQAGIGAKAGRKAYQAIWDINAPSHKDEAEGSASSVKYPGLSRQQEAPFEALVSAYKSGDKNAGEDVVRTVAELSAKRPDHVVPLLHNLREHAPSLYTAARAAVPKGSKVDEQMSYEEQSRIGAGVTPSESLGASVLSSVRRDGTVGDEEGYRELARRAGQKDPVAQKALMEVVKRSGSNKTLPAGSVFKQGAR